MRLKIWLRLANCHIAVKTRMEFGIRIRPDTDRSVVAETFDEAIKTIVEYKRWGMDHNKWLCPYYKLVTEWVEQDDPERRPMVDHLRYHSVTEVNDMQHQQKLLD